MDNEYNRRSFVRQVSTLLCTLPLAAFARQVPPARVRRIGFLIGGVQSLIDAFKLVPGGTFQFLPSCFLAVITTWSGSNPNFVCSSLSGADAPNVCMPITLSELPT